MGELQFQPDLLDEVAHRLDLREPNRKAVESVLLRTSDHYDVRGKIEPYECIVDSATGVGKTYVMAGLMEYLAGAETPARNFLLLAPGARYETSRPATSRRATPSRCGKGCGQTRSSSQLTTSTRRPPG